MKPPWPCPSRKPLRKPAVELTSPLARRPSLVALFQAANLTAAELDIVLVSLDNLGFDSSALLRDLSTKEVITVTLLKV